MPGESIGAWHLPKGPTYRRAPTEGPPNGTSTESKRLQSGIVPGGNPLDRGHRTGDTGYFSKGNFVDLTWLANRTDQVKRMQCTTHVELNAIAC